MTQSICTIYSINNYQFEPFEDLGNIINQWDNLLPENHHLKSNNLLFYHANCSTNKQYVLVKTNNQLIGIVYIQNLIITPKEINFPNLSMTGIQCIIKTLLSLNCTMKVAVIGNLFKNQNQGYYFINDTDTANILSELFAFLTKTYNVSGVILKENETVLALENIKGGVFEKFNDEHLMKMQISKHWKCMEDYALDLSKKYKKRYEKIKKSAASLLIRELTLAEIKLHQATIFKLYLEVYEKQNIKLGKIKEDYFYELKKLLKDDFFVFGVFKNDVLIAFSSHCNYNSDQTEIHYIGINYNHNDSYNLYFNILFWGLENAIKTEKTELSLGRTAFTAKASLGALPVKSNNYVYYQKGILKISLAKLLKSFYNKNNSDTNVRSPFGLKTIELV